MGTLLVAIGSFVGFIIAYHTYGRWLSNRIFNLDETAVVPSQQMRDDVDFVPTKKEVIFGHHFTSIAGTGPIVGPAIAVLWGWVPALLWVIFGSIFNDLLEHFWLPPGSPLGSILVPGGSKSRKSGNAKTQIKTMKKHTF